MFVRASVPCAVIFLIAADLPALQDAKKELEQLQGDWTMISQESKGQKVPGEIAKQFKLTIKGDQWTVTLPDGSENKMTIKIDPSMNPKTIDLMIKAGNTEVNSRGIYKLEGDTLTLCRTLGNVERPKEFKTTAEAGGLMVWKRVKK
jgi:uncharacterized protein (TIGR03067 family)